MSRARGPVGYTCPKIDNVITEVNSAIRRCAEGDPESAIDDMADVERYMEEIRYDNDQLRTWGSEQEDLAISRGCEIETLERQVDRLEGDIKLQKQEIVDLVAALERAEACQS